MADNRWHIRPYAPGDEERIVPFFNEIFAGSWDGFEPRTAEFWQWQFERNPVGHRHYIAEDASGRVIGSYAAIRAPLLFNGDRLVAAQVVDTCVHRDYRSTGLFIELGSAFLRHFGGPDQDAVFFGYPNPPAFRAGVRYLHYLPVDCPIHKLVLNFDASWVDRMSNLAGGRSATELTSLDARVDTLWNRVRKDLHLSTWRDREYLRWRYQSHPSIHYRFLAAHDASGDLSGCVVLRLGWFRDKVVPLVDWLIPRGDITVLTTLLVGAAKMALAHGFTRLETWLPPVCPERHDLSTLGFVGAETTFNLVTRLYHPSLTLEWVKDNWFYTMGDADFY